jgi:uncharacterized protein YjbI with pentapeptide repeats
MLPHQDNFLFDPQFFVLTDFERLRRKQNLLDFASARRLLRDCSVVFLMVNALKINGPKLQAEKLDYRVKADPIMANLSKAYLIGADLRETDISAGQTWPRGRVAAGAARCGRDAQKA